ncbi:MAG: hypothetical protein M1536_03270 [Firmicutes bacterium]|nr:hypothetical protein [Bacillota bacterium]
MKLLELISEKNIKTLSLIGMGKNVGKTTLLNHLIKEASLDGVVLGITSIGRDWEKKDILTELDKPRLRAPVGTFLITSESSLKESRIKREVIKKSTFRTSLGNLVVIKVLSRDFIEITGPQTTGQLKSLIPEMEKAKTDIIIVDGAFDRMFSAAPLITDGTILVTGAVIDPLMERVVEKTKWKAELLSLPGTKDESLQKIAEKICSHRRIAFVEKSGRYRSIEYMPTGACGEAAGKSITGEVKALVLGTSLTSSFIEGLIKTPLADKVLIIIHDATRILTDELWWKRLKNWGASVEVLMPVKLAAVTVNPYSVMGWEFDSTEFIDATGQALKPIPVVDVLSGLSRNIKK